MNDDRWTIEILDQNGVTRQLAPLTIDEDGHIVLPRSEQSYIAASYRLAAPTRELDRPIALNQSDTLRLWIDHVTTAQLTLAGAIEPGSLRAPREIFDFDANDFSDDEGPEDD